MSTPSPLSAVAQEFQMNGNFAGGVPYGNGHINDTYCITFHQAGVPVRFILQRINHNIFKSPLALMENIERVTLHLAAQVQGEPDCGRRVLTLIPARDGRACHVDTAGSYWRAYPRWRRNTQNSRSSWFAR